MTSNEKSLLADIQEGLAAQAVLTLGYIKTIASANITDATVLAKFLADVTTKLNAQTAAFKIAVDAEFNEESDNTDLTSDLTV